MGESSGRYTKIMEAIEKLMTSLRKTYSDDLFNEIKIKFLTVVFIHKLNNNESLHESTIWLTLNDNMQ
jgi:hypothetical protein